jgi:protoheme IX farnesyltransferase
VQTETPRAPLDVRALFADHLALTKPPIVLLLLVTALGGLFMAARGAPPLGVTLWVLCCGAMAAGGANSINHALDRDVDGLMRRTSRRPVATNRISARAAILQGLVFNAVAFALLTYYVNPLTALLTLSATLFYVLVYTKWLKRTSTQNIVIGGAAGAVPPMAGWAAVTGGLDLPAVYLFAIIFFWTPPHFWALSLLLKDDYARAGIPMLPVVRGVPETVRSILLYSVLLVALTVMFFLLPEVGLVYLIFAVPLGGALLWFAWRLWRTVGERGAKPLYLYSLLYLALLFAGVMIDASVAL